MQAKSSNAKYNGTPLSCTWHNPSSSSPTPNNGTDAPGNGEEVKNYDDASVGDGLYDGVGDTLNGNHDFDETDQQPPENEESVDYDYDEEEDFVDYD